MYMYMELPLWVSERIPPIGTCIIMELPLWVSQSIQPLGACIWNFHFGPVRGFHH